MRKINKFLKTIVVCLFAAFVVMTNVSVVANATELNPESSSVAIVEISGYDIDGGMLEAGKQITINLTLHNTSTSSAAGSVLMTMSSTSNMLYPVYGEDNQVYVGTIGAGSSKTVSVPVSVSSSFSGDSLDLVCEFDYETSGMSMSNTASIAIPTSGGSTIGVKDIDVSSHAIVNAKSLLSFSYVNQSNINITDAKLLVDGNVSSDSETIELDTIYAGKSYSNDYYVIFTEAGNQDVSITLTYTDSNDEVIEMDLGTFSVNVTKETVTTSTTGTSPIIKWVGRVVAALMMLAAVATVVIYIKKR